MSVLTRPSPAALTTPEAAGRRRLVLRAAVVLVGVLVFVGALRYFGAEKVAVLVAARDVPAGQVITDADLRTVHVTVGDDVATVAASARDTLVGETAAQPVAAGQLLSSAVVAPASPLAEDEALVGVVLTPGQYPPGLRQGDELLAVALPADGAARSEPGREIVVRAVTVRPTAGTQSGFSVALAVPREEAADLAVVSAQNRLLLVGVDAAGEG